MKIIKLYGGQKVKVDDWDYGTLKNYKWHMTGSGYAEVSRYMGNYKTVKTLMHQAIMWVSPGFQIDHINRDKLDNRKRNLRVATAQQNSWNHSIRSDNRSGAKGVSWDKGREKWRADIYITRGQPKLLGRFDSKTEAIEIYNEAAKEAFGEFAYLNKT